VVERDDIPKPMMLDVLGVRRPPLKTLVDGGGTNEFLLDDRVASEGRVAVGGSGSRCAGGFTIGADDTRRGWDASCGVIEYI
jgi:hypothetical protein